MSTQSGPLAPAAVGMLSAFAGLGAAVSGFGLASNLLSEDLVLHRLAAGIAWPAALAVAICSALLLSWAVLSFRAGHPVQTRRVGIALGVLVAVELLSFGWQFSQKHLDGGLLATIALQLLLLGTLGWLARRPNITPGTPAAGRLLLVMFAAALLVSAVTTAGLAAGTAGQFSIPHDQMQMNIPGFETGHHH
ncbi:hypothetical protein [Psychromicrobium lacuslunae]|uniref:hypothetical protein n=1 Tax=Psychromicrobium lacuslunae TaxID=1618207 RepID=UPI00069651FA|nr:hypothetical protein [Psychromicrobium lacuslunae]